MHFRGKVRYFYVGLSHKTIKGKRCGNSTVSFTSTVKYSTVSDTFMKDSRIISVQSQHGLT